MPAEAKTGSDFRLKTQYIGKEHPVRTPGEKAALPTLWFSCGEQVGVQEGLG